MSTGNLVLSYQPPFNWQHLLSFYRKRAIEGIETVGEGFYSRTFTLGQSRGHFTATLANDNALMVEFEIDHPEAIDALTVQIRRLFDLDADITAIEKHLKATAIGPILSEGLRIPGVWSPWEAGIRAIFGQQISITAAITLLNKFVQSLNSDHQHTRYFPTPLEIACADLSVIKMPLSRKETLQRFAQFMVEHENVPPDDWIKLKGIGPWTISYAKLRGLSQRDCFLSTDLVVKKAVKHLTETTSADSSTLSDDVSPWGSYATFNCWNASI